MKEPCKQWTVYHVQIDDKIIEQAYANWRDPGTYVKIKVGVQAVASGKSRLSTIQKDELLYDIAKKVPAFAVRGPVTSCFPFTASMGKEMGVKKNSRIYLYRIKENKEGAYVSKKVCTTRATAVSSDTTRMYMISGKLPSIQKGDIAVLRDRHRSAVSLLGQASLGNDARMGGRIQYEYLLDFSRHGIAQYLLAAGGYNRHDKEPDGIWWDEKGKAQPSLNNANVSIGYGVGFNLLGKIELMPYVMAGYQYTFLTGYEGVDLQYWDNGAQQWDYMSPSPDSETQSLSFSGFTCHAGARLTVNIWYPLQLAVGADYNYSTEAYKMKPLLDSHKINRVNLYAGLRFHF